MGFSILKRVKYAKLIKFSKNFIKKKETREDSRLFKNVLFSTWIFQNQWSLNRLVLKLNIMVTSILIILFEQMLQFFNSFFFKYQNFVEEIKESFTIFKNILFINMNFSKYIKLFNRLVLKLPSHYDKYLRVENILA